MIRRPTRFASALAVAAMLTLPGATLAGEAAASAPPAAVLAWQEHLDDMRALGPNLGAHVTDCVSMHGSMADLLGPNGRMVQGMAAMMGEGK